MRRSPLHIILFVAMVDLIGFGLIIPLQASYANRLGANGVTFGLLIGVYALMQLIFNPILGRWSDHVGRRKVLLISICGSVFSHILLGVADLAQSLPLLFLARILDGITGANVATAQAYIADVTTAENRAKGMGLFGAAFGLGFVIGPSLGALLVYVGKNVSGEIAGTSWPAFGAAAIACVAAYLVWRHLPEPKRQSTTGEKRTYGLNLRAFGSAMKQDRLRELLTLLLMATFSFVLLEATFVYICADLFNVTEVGVGLVFAYIGLLLVIVQGGLLGRLVKRFGEVRLVTVAPFITAVGFLLMAMVPMAGSLNAGWRLLLIACVPIALGNGLTGPNLSSLISRQASGDNQGATLGLAQGIGSLGRAFGPPIGGLLYDVGPSWPYWVGAAMLFGIGLFAISVRGAQLKALSAQTNVA